MEQEIKENKKEENNFQDNDSTESPAIDESDDDMEEVNDLSDTFLEVVSHLDTYVSPISDIVTRNILEASGVEVEDPRVLRLLSLCAHKFTADIINDALHHAKSAQGGTGMRKQVKEKKYIMTPEDLEAALKENGIQDFKPPYYL